MTDKNPTKAQVLAAERFAALKKQILKALGKKFKPLSAIITKLEEYAEKPRTPDFGSPSPKRCRDAMRELIDEGLATKQGDRRTAEYAKA